MIWDHLYQREYKCDGSGTGNFVSNLTGLTAGTTYYYRDYATNATGTVYGEKRTLSTN